MRVFGYFIICWLGSFFGMVVAVAGVVVTMPGDAGAVLKSQQVQIKGLLVMELPGGTLAAQTSPLTATALPTAEAGMFKGSFNQDVGDSMRSGLSEGVKFLTVRHGRLPGGVNVEFSFGERYSDKDGPSATVACVLMLESMITGSALRKDFAVTGDMNADGSVQPIGGVVDKVRAAGRDNCPIVGIPIKNRLPLLDHVLLGGIQDIAATQVFQLEKFDDAFAIARVDGEEAVMRAIDRYEKLRPSLSANPGAARNAAVQEELRGILEDAPNHLSARLLLMASTNRLPSNLSLAGSLELISQSSEQLFLAIESGGLERAGAFDEDQFRKIQSDLNRYRPMLDPRTKGLSDGFDQLSAAFRAYRLNPPRTEVRDRQMMAEIQAAVSKITSEEAKLMQNQEVQEQLMGE